MWMSYAPEPLLPQKPLWILGISKEEDEVILIWTPEETEGQICLPAIKKGAELTF